MENFRIKPNDIAGKLRRFPPLVCYLLAREGSGHSARHLGAREIARRGGMDTFEVISLSWIPTWDGITVSKMFQFASACGVDLNSRDNLHLHQKALKPKRFTWLKHDMQEYQHEFYPRLVAYQQWLQSNLINK